MKSLNEQLNQRLGTLSDAEEDFTSIQQNYNEATQIIEEQKKEIQELMREIEE